MSETPRCDAFGDEPYKGDNARLVLLWIRFAESLERDLTQAKAELAAVREDAERLDWLEELTKRLATWEGASGKVEKWLETDVCIRGPNVNIYIRNEYGQHIRGGTGSCVRLAIDSAREQQP